MTDPSPNEDELLLSVYDELRKLAAARLAREKPGQTLPPTGLVHDVWLRLSGGAWQSREHFFAAAAETMRRILIDRARSKLSQRRGGEWARAEYPLDAVESPLPDDRLLELNEALQRLEELAPEKAQLVKLRYFVGCSIKDAAEIMEISTATADRYWAYARSWLQTEMQWTDTKSAPKKSEDG